MTDHPTDILYKWDLIAGTVEPIGSTGWSCSAEMTIMDGEIYFVHRNIGGSPLTISIIKLDPINPGNSIPLVTFSANYWVIGITASPFANNLYGANEIGEELVLINLIDGEITPVCPIEPGVRRIATPIEHNYIPQTFNYIDLDCNDSSGATEADYNSPDFDCLSDGVPVNDIDLKIITDGLIDELTIEIMPPMPDQPQEILQMLGSIGGITSSGSGTSMITLTNSGAASSRDFMDALDLIFYRNTAAHPTGGPRTVEVQFTTQSGAMSNIATAFIQVNELPLIEVDLGPDQEVCEGDLAIFDAANPGAMYAWSNGASSQTISTGIPEEYIVTVSDGENCPNQDTALLISIPVIEVSLTGDEYICDNESATLLINTDASFPLTIEINLTPGGTLTFDDVTGNYSFTDLPGGYTEYSIISVTPSSPACIEITDPLQEIFVFPTYDHSAEAGICDGDSIWLGYYWETDAGVYEIPFNSVNGCDSTVIYAIEVLPAIQLNESGSTCIPADVGIFTTFIDNPTGCDTQIVTTVSLVPADTTYLTSVTCSSQNAGIFTTLAINQHGCDSLIITTITAIPPQDTTLIVQLTCDSSLFGVTQSILTNSSGCDSLIIINTMINSSDTTYLNSLSCDSGSIGVFQTLLNNQEGCDSLVILTVSPGTPDTSYVNTTSCDSSSLGVIEETLMNMAGCDSLVITTISFSKNDSTFLHSTTCDELQAGVFVTNYINRFGCDSIVTSTVLFIPSDETFLNSTTCEESEAGTFINTLTNQFGCDSIITEIIELLPSDEIFISSTTCHPELAGMFITTHLNQYGCDSVVTQTITLVESDTTVLNSSTCFPNEVSSGQILYSGKDGCDSLVITSVELFPLPALSIAIDSDFNGYAISCAGGNDGSISANVVGIQPISYEWSNGSDGQTLEGLSAGIYAVTIVDGNGCEIIDEVALQEPPPFSFELTITHPDCFTKESGSIAINQAGGIEPIRYSIDGVNYQASPLFDQLDGGTYEVVAIDANDCEVKEILWINVPLEVNVEVGDDMILFPGESAELNAIVNVPYDSLVSVVWTGLESPDCPTCLTQPVAPIITTTYSITVTSLDGCRDDDQLTLFVEKNTDIFIPNLFTPNNDGINDRIWISAARDVEKIISLNIYDRWGNAVFEATNFLPNDEAIGWDGKFDGKELNPGVFAYRVTAKLVDGPQIVIYGDITLIR